MDDQQQQPARTHEYLAQLPNFIAPITHPSAQPFHELFHFSPLALEDLHLGDHDLYDVENVGELPSVRQYFAKETALTSRLRKLRETGEAMLNRFYTYRPCARAIPQVQATDTPEQKAELYRRTYEILAPEVARMRAFMRFRDESVREFTDAVKTCMADTQKDSSNFFFFASRDFLLALASILDLFVVMDAVKNMKSSMNNDFSLYKRTLSFVAKEINVMDDAMENQKLYFFLGQTDQFSSELKKQLTAFAVGFEDIIADVISECVDIFEKGKYILPETKFMLLKAMAFGIFLIDSPDEDRDINKRKKLKLERFGRVFKANTIIPLYGDMPLRLASIYGRAPHIGATKWVTPDDEAASKPAYSLLTHIARIRSDNFELVARLKWKTNTLREIFDKRGAFSYEESLALYNVYLDGLHFVSRTAALVLEQTAFKYANPAFPDILRGIPVEAGPYELAVKYNYTDEEKSVLIEVIVIIKTLGKMLLQHDRYIREALNRHVYLETSKFVKGPLLDAHQHASKKKRAIAALIAHIQNIAHDGALGPVPFEHPAAAALSPAKKTNSAVSGSTFHLDTRDGKTSALALTQLHYIRVLLNFSYNERAKGMKGGLMKDKDFKDSQIDEMNKFYDDSFFFPQMMNFDSVLKKACDLSDLWYREFYLELSKKVQFPIEMSLPWILADFILEGDDLGLSEYVFFPFDIYNDAGNRALHVLRSRHVFDEIEGEVNLCFDQFVFKISQKVYSVFRHRGSMQLLGWDAKSELEINSDANELHKTLLLQRMLPIMRERSLQLLGRSIDVSRLIAQVMNQNLRKSIDLAISRFEASDLASIKELEALLDASQRTHALLAEHLTLDAYEDMLMEVNESTSLTYADSRITAHVIIEILDDVIGNHCYNSISKRFHRAPQQFVEVQHRSLFPKAPPIFLFGTRGLFHAFAYQNAVYKNFVGAPHFKTACRLLGSKGVQLLHNEMERHLTLLISKSLIPYVGAVQKGVKNQIALPMVEYGFRGAYEFFCAHLKSLLVYPDLKDQIFQSMREVGNVIVVMKEIEEVLAVEQVFTNLQTRPLVARAPGHDASIISLILQNANSQFNGNDYGQSYNELAKNIDRLHLDVIKAEAGRTDPPRPSLTKSLLQTLRAAVLVQSGQEHTWAIQTFFKFWSAVFFAFVSRDDSRKLFGDSVVYTGCGILYLLKQMPIFLAFDYTGHMLSVQRAAEGDPSNPLADGGADEAARAAERGAYYVALNEEVHEWFASLEAQNAGAAEVASK